MRLSAQTISPAVNMRTAVLLCFFVAVVLLEVVNAQRFSTHFSREYQRNRRLSDVLSSDSTVVRTYVPSKEGEGRDRGVSAASEGEAKKVRLDIFYETDCPDSMRFITRQLYPLYQEMKDVLDIHLVPYGKAMQNYNADNQKYDFRCQHGPSECYGNTVQSCVISLYPKTEEYMNFVNCMEFYPRPSRNGNKCARRLSLDWEKIDKCAKSNEGNRLLYENALLTENLNPRLYFVPWIVVNKVFSESNQRMGLRNLLGVVCDAYKGSHPKCQR